MMALGILYLPYPYWYVLLCLAAGVAAALLLYFRETQYRDKPMALRLSMAGLRAFTVALLAFLLLSPLLKRTTSELRKPIVVLLQDASESVGLALGQQGPDELKARLDKLSDQLEADFEVDTWAFGEEIRSGADWTFPDKQTDMEQALRHVREVYDPQRLGAVVLLSDGLYNRGAHPLYSSEVTRAPLYALGLGNPDPVRDLAIKRVLHNKIAYKGDRFTVQLDLSGRNIAGERTLLEVFDITGATPRLLQSLPIDLPVDPWFETRELVLDALETGMRRYRFSLRPLEGERNRANNTRDMYIEVLDARQKVLLLADAPHPDLSALKQSLAEGRNYQVDLRFARDPGAPLRTYDLVVLHQLPSQRQDARGILQEIRQQQIPVWFILGAQSELRGFNAAQGLLQVRGDGRNTNESSARPVKDFQVFTLSEELGRRLPQFPPLITPFGDYTTGARARVLLQQKIASVNTDYPLWVLGEEEQVRVGVTAGEGIWRWRMFDHLQHKSHQLTDELIGKTVQYLALKDDKRRFRVQPSRPLFGEHEQVLFDGEFYNENYEALNTPDVEVLIRDAAGREYPYTMNKSASGYTLQAGLFPPGSYTFRARTSFNSQDFQEEGRFTVEAMDQEQADIQADHNLLRLLAQESGGQMLGIDDLEGLPALLKEDKRLKPILYSQTQTRPLIDWRWLFAFLLMSLGLEWFLRRYFGAY